MIKKEKYNLAKTVAKTLKQNSDLLQLDSKTLVDISHLKDYDTIPDYIMEDINIHTMKYLSAANTTMFCGKCDTFQAYDGILKFQCMRVFNNNGYKHCYNIFVLQSINRLNYGERSSVYNKMFDENMINISEDHIFERTIDIELE